jgi:2-aminoadipate transaminase
MSNVHTRGSDGLYAGRVRGTEATGRSGNASRPGVISLAGGHPDTSIFDGTTLARMSHAIARDGPTALQYGPTAGMEAMRKTVAKVMAAEGIPARKENVLVTNGAQQGLDLMGKVFLEEGDAVIAESPTYHGALAAFAAYGPRVLPVPVDHSGMEVGKVRDILEADHRVKFIYTIPTFHNPTGTTMSLGRRLELLDLAREYDVAILEDNPYGLLGYEGDAPPSLAALAQEELGEPDKVVYLGTFSKIFAPGVRLGWVHARPEILEKMHRAKRGADLGPSNLSQILTTTYFEGDEWRVYLERLKASYRERRDAALDFLSEFMPEVVSWSRPDGGFFVWVTLPHAIDTSQMLPQAVARNVSYVPGAEFYADGGGANHLRLSFASAEPRLLRRAVRVLGELIRESIDRAETGVPSGVRLPRPSNSRDPARKPSKDRRHAKLAKDDANAGGRAPEVGDACRCALVTLPR